MYYPPKEYLVNEARNLQFHECWVNEDWEDSGIACITISKRQENGEILFGAFQVEPEGDGIMNTFFLINQPESRFRTAVDRMIYSGEAVPCDLDQAHELILAGLWTGNKPHSDFEFTRFILDHDLSSAPNVASGRTPELAIA